MSDTLVWIIALGFYAPFHYLGPLLVSFLTGHETRFQRRQLIIKVLIDCSVTLIVGFALAIWLFKREPTLAMLVLVVSMCLPYLHIVIARKYARVKRAD